MKVWIVEREYYKSECGRYVVSIHKSYIEAKREALDWPIVTKWKRGCFKNTWNSKCGWFTRVFKMETKK